MKARQSPSPNSCCPFCTGTLIRGPLRRQCSIIHGCRCQQTITRGLLRKSVRLISKSSRTSTLKLAMLQFSTTMVRRCRNLQTLKGNFSLQTMSGSRVMGALLQPAATWKGCSPSLMTLTMMGVVSSFPTRKTSMSSSRRT